MKGPGSAPAKSSSAPPSSAAGAPRGGSGSGSPAVDEREARAALKGDSAAKAASTKAKKAGVGARGNDGKDTGARARGKATPAKRSAARLTAASAAAAEEDEEVVVIPPPLPPPPPLVTSKGKKKAAAASLPSEQRHQGGGAGEEKKDVGRGSKRIDLVFLGTGGIRSIFVLQHLVPMLNSWSTGSVTRGVDPALSGVGHRCHESTSVTCERISRRISAKYGAWNL